MEKISKYQLAAMIILFEIGSSTLFELGIKAKTDAWLAVIISVIASLLLLMLFLGIQHREPDKSLIQVLLKYLGPFFGRVIGFSYILYFAYESMRNVRDFGDITIMTFLSKTPISLIMLIMIILSSYAIFKGVEVFFRVAEFMLPGVLLFHILIIIMYFSADIVHLDRLLPILENGIRPILKTTIEETLWMPFGQMILFLMYWNYLNEKRVMFKTSIRAYIIVGILLTVHNILNIAILGTSYTSISNIPFLESVRLIQIANFLERFDPLVVLLIYVGLFIKATLWYLAAVLGLGQILNLKDNRKLIFPIGGIIYVSSFLAPNWINHIWYGTEISRWVNPTFIFFIPIFLFLVMLLVSTLLRKDQKKSI